MPGPNEHIRPFHFWLQFVTPLEFADSLSYYETLLKVKHKLNEVIELANQVADQVGTFQGTLTQLQNDVTQINNQINNINNHLNLLDNTTSSLQQQINNINNTISSIQNSINTINGQITTINNTLTTYNNRITALEQEMQVVKQTLIEINDALTSINNQISIINNHLTSIDQQITVINQHLSTHDTQIATLQSDLTVLSNRVTQAETNIQNLFTITADLQTQITQLNQIVDPWDNNNIKTIQQTFNDAYNDSLVVGGKQAINPFTSNTDTVNNIFEALKNYYYGMFLDDAMVTDPSQNPEQLNNLRDTLYNIFHAIQTSGMIGWRIDDTTYADFIYIIPIDNAGDIASITPITLPKVIIQTFDTQTSQNNIPWVKLVWDTASQTYITTSDSMPLNFESGAVTRDFTTIGTNNSGLYTYYDKDGNQLFQTAIPVVDFVSQLSYLDGVFTFYKNTYVNDVGTGQPAYVPTIYTIDINNDFNEYQPFVEIYYPNLGSQSSPGGIYGIMVEDVLSNTPFDWYNSSGYIRLQNGYLEAILKMTITDPSIGIGKGVNFFKFVLRSPSGGIANYKDLAFFDPAVTVVNNYLNVGGRLQSSTGFNEQILSSGDHWVIVSDINGYPNNFPGKAIQLYDTLMTTESVVYFVIRHMVEIVDYVAP